MVAAGGRRAGEPPIRQADNFMKVLLPLAVVFCYIEGALVFVVPVVALAYVTMRFRNRPCD